MNALKLLRALDAAQNVSRWHTVRTLGRQNLAEHSYEVALICARVGVGAHVLLAALEHDLGEETTGDVPAPFKRGAPQAGDLIDRAEAQYATGALGCAPGVVLQASERWLLKFADIVSGLRFALDELELGNRRMLEGAVNFHLYMNRHWVDGARVPDNRWRDCCLGLFYLMNERYEKARTE